MNTNNKLQNRQRHQFANLTKDTVFKYYFENKSLLKSLLKAFLPLPDPTAIEDVQILNSQLTSPNPEEKGSTMDLKVKLSSGEFVNVEMQGFPHQGFKERILFYWAKNYSSQLKRGEEHKQLCPMYSLVFSAGNLFKGREYFYTTFSLRSNTAPYVYFSKDIQMVTVELGKFKRGKIKDLLDLREQWCYVLKESGTMGEEELKALSKKGPEMEVAMSYLKAISKEERLRLFEQSKEMFRMDQANIRRQIKAEATEEGLREGMREGMREGKKAGMKEGKKTALIQVAVNMLRKGADTELISEFTGLSAQELKQIRENGK